MAQKWNLQDIRPAGGRDKRLRAPRTSRPDMEERTEGNERAEHRGSQDITPRRQPEAHSKRMQEELDPDLASIDIINGRTSKRKRIIVSSVIVAVILVAGFFVNTLLGGAEILVYPKFKDITVQATFTAHKEPGANELGYELLSFEANSERQVKATGEEEVSERSTGSIFIYNEFSQSSQRLIKNTRFESPEGLIYRIDESVEIPGYTEDEDGSIVPGVITAEVFADGTGEQYNISPTRFVVPGLEGSEQYDSIYAESTDSFNGGFEGKRFIIDEAELQTAKQALHLELRDALLARLENEKPAGFVVYQEAVTFAFDTLPATEYGSNLATIKERARLQVPIFEDKEFATFLAENTVAGYEGAPVTVDDPYSLEFSYPSPTTTTSDISELTQIPFNLTGSSRVIWDFDEEQLSQDLVGLSKTALPSVLSGYPAIERAEAVVRPFWRQSFPADASEVEVVVSFGENTE